MSAAPKRSQAPKQNDPKTIGVFDVIGSADALIFQLAGKGGDWKVSGVPQLLAILLIQAETIAKSRKPGTPPPMYSRPITLTEFARKCGCSKEYAWRMLTDARSRGLIDWITAKQAAELGIPPERGHVQALRYKLRPEKWALAPAYVAPEDAESDDGAEDDEDEGAEQQPEQKKAAIAAPVTLQCGEKTEPAAIPETVKRFAFQCAGDSAVVMEARHTKDVILFIARAENKQLTAATVNLQVHSGKSGYGEAGAQPLLSAAGLPFESVKGWKELALAFENVMVPIQGCAEPRPLSIKLNERLASACLKKLKKGIPAEFVRRCAVDRFARAVRSNEPITSSMAMWIIENANEEWPAHKAEWEQRRSGHVNQPALFRQPEEFPELAAREAHLRAHPEECTECGGSGVTKSKARTACNFCPAGDDVRSRQPKGWKQGDKVAV